MYRIDLSDAQIPNDGDWITTREAIQAGLDFADPELTDVPDEVRADMEVARRILAMPDREVIEIFDEDYDALSRLVREAQEYYALMDYDYDPNSTRVERVMARKSDLI